MSVVSTLNALQAMSASMERVEKDTSCRWACEHARSCLDAICEDEVLGLNDCIERCEQEPEAFAARNLGSTECADIERGLCPEIRGVCSGCPQPGPDAFNIGAACSDDVDCRADNLRAYCIPTGENTDQLRGGYCTGLNCRFGGCGPNAPCVGFNEDLTGCILLCDDTDQCHMGYAWRDERLPPFLTLLVAAAPASCPA